MFEKRYAHFHSLVVSRDEGKSNWCEWMGVRGKVGVHPCSSKWVWVTVGPWIILLINQRSMNTYPTLQAVTTDHSRHSVKSLHAQLPPDQIYKLPFFELILSVCL